MSNPKRVRIPVVLRRGDDLFDLLKVERRGFDTYCFPPDVPYHYSAHESGEAHIRKEHPRREPEREPGFLLMDGEIGPRTRVSDLGRADCVCVVGYQIDSPDSDLRPFTGNQEPCFVIDAGSLPPGTAFLEIGVWTVPSRNEASFHFNNPGLTPESLHKVSSVEPQIWMYARPW